MRHEHENAIICPYCNHEEKDSWEYNDEGQGTWKCGACDEEFDVVRDVEVTYSTFRTSCEEDKHDYQLEKYFASTKDLDSNGKWSSLEEKDYTYHKIIECSICGDKDYPEVPKEEYEKRLSIT